MSSEKKSIREKEFNRHIINLEVDKDWKEEVVRFKIIETGNLINLAGGFCDCGMLLDLEYLKLLKVLRENNLLQENYKMRCCFCYARDFRGAVEEIP